MIIWQEIRQAGIFASQSDIFDKCPVLNEFFKTKPTMIQRLSLKQKWSSYLMVILLPQGHEALNLTNRVQHLQDAFQEG